MRIGRRLGRIIIDEDELRGTQGRRTDRGIQGRIIIDKDELGRRHGRKGRVDDGAGEIGRRRRRTIEEERIGDAANGARRGTGIARIIGETRMEKVRPRRATGGDAAKRLDARGTLGDID